MEIPLELFSLFIIISIALAGIGLWRKIPMLMFLGGFFIAFWSTQTDTIITDSFASGLTDNLYSYNVESNSGTNALNNVNFGYAQFASASNSALVGDQINCIDIYLSKTLSPTGTAEIGTLDASNNIIVSFGTQNVALLTTSAQWYSYCKIDPYTIQNQDRIGIKYTAGTATDFVSIRGDSANPFDGTITFRQTFTAGAWSSTTSTDQTFRFYLSGGDFDITNNNFVFDGYAKVMFIVFGAIMLLAGAIVWKLD